jgi:phosphatidylethanolamine-binding protein (PEBP) family uncharacterized protein
MSTAPLAEHGLRRYFVVVHAFDVESIGVPADAAAFLGFTMTSNVPDHAVLTAPRKLVALPPPVWPD